MGGMPVLLGDQKLFVTGGKEFGGEVWISCKIPGAKVRNAHDVKPYPLTSLRTKDNEVLRFADKEVLEMEEKDMEMTNAQRATPKGFGAYTTPPNGEGGI